jgi:hypothetical protein
VVVIEPPPPLRAPQPVFHTVTPGTAFLRLYDPTKHGATALSFRHYGPISRFDHQPEPRAEDPSRAILYVARTLSGCLVEIFGDAKLINVGFWEVAFINCTRDLYLLDLRGANAMRAGTLAAVCEDSNRTISQAWSRYFYENSFLYSPVMGRSIDGLIFGNAHNDEDAVALYERCQSDFTCRAVCSLNDASLRTEVKFIARDTGIYVQPY